MKNIRLSAYLQNNLGDDLMVKILLDRYKEYRFYFDSNSVINETLMSYTNFLHHEKVFKKYGRLNHLFNILTFNKKPDYIYKRILNKIKSDCCCSVYIGGSIYYSRPNETPEQHIEKEMKRSKPSPMFVIGANFGTNETKEYVDAYAEYFSTIGGVSFRDNSSYNLFKHLNNVQCASDVVFNLNVESKKTAEKDNTVLISVVNCDNKANKASFTSTYEKSIADICHDALNKGLKPVLVSFCRNEGDEIAAERICGYLPDDVKPKIGKYYYLGNIDEALDLFAKAQYVIATRFHAMILAMIFETPFFAISYDEKIINVLRDMNIDSYCDMGGLEKLSETSVFDMMSGVIPLRSYIDDASCQFKQLDEYLSRLK